MKVKDRYDIDPDEKKNLLGKGSYGSVYKATDKVSGKQVALKVIQKKKLSIEEYDMIQSEIEISLILSEDDHPGISKIYDFYNDQDTVTIVMELIKGKNMFAWLMEYQ